MRTHQVGFGLALLSTLVVCAPRADAGDGASKVMKVRVPGGGRPVAAKTDETGTIHLVYDSEDGPRYERDRPMTG